MLSTLTFFIVYSVILAIRSYTPGERLPYPVFYFFTRALRNELYTGVDYATGTIPGNLYVEILCDNIPELFFPDQFWKTGCPALECPDPFIPEQHALNIADLVLLHMSPQELFQYLDFMGIFRSGIDPG